MLGGVAGRCYCRHVGRIPEVSGKDRWRDYWRGYWRGHWKLTRCGYWTVADGFPGGCDWEGSRKEEASVHLTL